VIGFTTVDTALVSTQDLTQSFKQQNVDCAKTMRSEVINALYYHFELHLYLWE